MSEETREFVVSLLAATPEAVFVAGRKIIVEISRDGSVRVDYEPGIRLTRPLGAEPDSQASQSRTSQPHGVSEQ